MEEKWITIPEWEHYQVSNFGRVRTVGVRKSINVNGISKDLKAKEIKGSRTKLGYIIIRLVDGNNRKNVYLHRLVASLFIPNPENKPCVNHIDNNPSNNQADNLEWCTNKENTAWMIKQGRFDRTQTWLDKLRETKKKERKAVKGICLLGGDTRIYEKLNDVTKDGFQPSCVSNCCNGIRKSHKGYLWEFI